MIIERFIGGQAIRPGVRIQHHSNLDRPQIVVTVVCDQVDPDVWHGEVALFGRTVVTTESFPTDDEAGRNAERRFIDKVTALLAD